MTQNIVRNTYDPNRVTKVNEQSVINTLTQIGVFHFANLTALKSYCDTPSPLLALVGTRKALYLNLGNNSGLTPSDPEIIQDTSGDIYQQITTFDAGEDIRTETITTPDATLVAHTLYSTFGSAAKTFSLPHPADHAGDIILLANDKDSAPSITFSIRQSNSPNNQFSGTIRGQTNYVLESWGAYQSMILYSTGGSWEILGEANVASVNSPSTIYNASLSSTSITANRWFALNIDQTAYDPTNTIDVYATGTGTDKDVFITRFTIEQLRSATNAVIPNGTVNANTTGTSKSAVFGGSNVVFSFGLDGNGQIYFAMSSVSVKPNPLQMIRVQYGVGFHQSDLKPNADSRQRVHSSSFSFFGVNTWTTTGIDTSDWNGTDLIDSSGTDDGTNARPYNFSDIISGVTVDELRARGTQGFPSNNTALLPNDDINVGWTGYWRGNEAHQIVFSTDANGILLVARRSSSVPQNLTSLRIYRTVIGETIAGVEGNDGRAGYRPVTLYQAFPVDHTLVNADTPTGSNITGIDFETGVLTRTDISIDASWSAIPPSYNPATHTIFVSTGYWDDTNNTIVDDFTTPRQWSGPPGAEGPPGADSTVPGPPGKDSTVPGPEGPQGEQGRPGISVVGETGPRGEYPIRAFFKKTRATRATPPPRPEADGDFDPRTRSLNFTNPAWNLSIDEAKAFGGDFDSDTDDIWESFADYTPATALTGILSRFADPFILGQEGPPGRTGEDAPYPVYVYTKLLQTDARPSSPPTATGFNVTSRQATGLQPTTWRNTQAAAEILNGAAFNPLTEVIFRSLAFGNTDGTITEFTLPLAISGYRGAQGPQGNPGADSTVPGPQGRPGAAGANGLTLATLTVYQRLAHGSTAPSLPTATGLNTTNGMLQNLLSPWTQNYATARGTDYDPNNHDIWKSHVFYNGTDLGSFTPPVKDDGEAGSPGADGMSFNPRGDWSMNATYNRLDAVRFDNGLYVALKTTQVQPTLKTTTADWMFVIEDTASKKTEIYNSSPDLTTNLWFDIGVSQTSFDEKDDLQILFGDSSSNNPNTDQPLPLVPIKQLRDAQNAVPGGIATGRQVSIFISGIGSSNFRLWLGVTSAGNIAIATNASDPMPLLINRIQHGASPSQGGRPLRTVLPMNGHAGVYDLDGTDTGQVPSSNVYTTQSGNQPIRFDNTSSRFNIPDSTSYDPSNGQFAPEAGFYLVCMSAKIKNNNSGGQNSRAILELGLRDIQSDGTINNRHSADEYLRWGVQVPSAVTQRPSNAESFVTGKLSVLASFLCDGTNKFSINAVWDQQAATTMGITVEAAHVHFVRITDYSGEVITDISAQSFIDIVDTEESNVTITASTKDPTKVAVVAPEQAEYTPSEEDIYPIVDTITKAGDGINIQRQGGATNRLTVNADIHNAQSVQGLINQAGSNVTVGLTGSAGDTNRKLTLNAPAAPAQRAPTASELLSRIDNNAGNVDAGASPNDSTKIALTGSSGLYSAGDTVIASAENTDILSIQDASDSNNPKKITVANLFSGRVGGSTLTLIRSGNFSVTSTNTLSITGISFSSGVLANGDDLYITIQINRGDFRYKLPIISTNEIALSSDGLTGQIVIPGVDHPVSNPSPGLGTDLPPIIVGVSNTLWMNFSFPSGTSFPVTIFDLRIFRRRYS